ncbi:unnamed protein product [Vitrella brassicaformis CCMP3155]|uniref:Integrase catalytic domain-containing protein n=1 Tax=Vitrella brassicaformis (strain CCMP3155) TaxID=1169540 RepID=A0A0G4GU44_VITBC|nr:unnamed protein product [Vitrella brassicaformis CCMP3155]|eukprot:CEM34297.1 unnamed protein product [Vitrella brassicaformis CCMP3155]
MKIKPAKCYFGYPEISLVGHRVSKEGIATEEEKIAAIENMQHTSMQTQKDIRAFLGMTGYYHKFVPAYAHIAAPLTELTKKDLKYTYSEHWTDECTTAFEVLKGLLCRAPILAYPDYTKPFILKTDASDVAIGAALTQRDEAVGIDRPVAYASRKLRGNEPTYAAQEREALAVINFIKYFRPYLYRVHFTVVTDHRSLQSLPKAYEKGNPRLLRWSVLLQHYSFSVIWKPGRENHLADALSRVQASHWDPLPRLQAPVTAQDMAPRLMASLAADEPSVVDLDTFREEQQKDPYISALILYLQSDSKDRTLPDDEALARQVELAGQMGHYDVIDGLLMRKPDRGRTPIPRAPRIVVPPSLRMLVFSNCHDSPLAGHMGVVRTIDRISNRFWWPTMNGDVATWVGCCPVCQAFRPHRKEKYPQMPLPIHEDAFSSVAVDFMGPYVETDRKNHYILVFVDQLTGWPEAVALPVADGESVAQAFVDLIVARHGCPRRLLSDRGSHFLNELVDAVCAIFRARRIFSSSYHPETNGQAESMVKNIKKVLSRYVASHRTDWDVLLPLILFSIRTARNEATGMSPFEALYGREARLPLDVMVAWEQPIVMRRNDYRKVLIQQLKAVQQKCRANRDAERDKRMRRSPPVPPREYKVGEKVWVTVGDPAKKGAAFAPRYTGPYRVVKQMENCPMVYVVRPAGEGATRSKPVHMRRMRPYLDLPLSDKNRPLFRYRPKDTHVGSEAGEGDGQPDGPAPQPPQSFPPQEDDGAGGSLGGGHGLAEDASADVPPPIDALPPADEQAAGPADPQVEEREEHLSVDVVPLDAVVADDAVGLPVAGSVEDPSPVEFEADAPSDPADLPSSLAASALDADSPPVDQPDPHTPGHQGDGLDHSHARPVDPPSSQDDSSSAIPPSYSSNRRQPSATLSPLDLNDDVYMEIEKPPIREIIRHTRTASHARYYVRREGRLPAWENESELSDQDALRAYETGMAFNDKRQKRARRAITAAPRPMQLRSRKGR